MCAYVCTCVCHSHGRHSPVALVWILPPTALGDPTTPPPRHLPEPQHPLPISRGETRETMERFPHVRVRPALAEPPSPSLQLQPRALGLSCPQRWELQQNPSDQPREARSPRLGRGHWDGAAPPPALSHDSVSPACLEPASLCLLPQGPRLAITIPWRIRSGPGELGPGDPCPPPSRASSPSPALLG